MFNFGFWKDGNSGVTKVFRPPRERLWWVPPLTSGGGGTFLPFFPLQLYFSFLRGLALQRRTGKYFVAEVEFKENESF